MTAPVPDVVVARRSLSLIDEEARACPDCGHKFALPRQPALSETAATIDPLYARHWWPVRRVHYARHQKPGKPPLLRVGYEIEGGRWINEWLPIESKHRVARIKACQWWKQQAPEGPRRCRLRPKCSVR